MVSSEKWTDLAGEAGQGGSDKGQTRLEG